MNYKDHFIDRIANKNLTLRKVTNSIEDLVFGYESDRCNFVVSNGVTDVRFTMYYKPNGVVYKILDVYGNDKNCDEHKLDYEYEISENCTNFESICEAIFDKFINYIIDFYSKV